MCICIVYLSIFRSFLLLSQYKYLHILFLSFSSKLLGLISSQFYWRSIKKKKKNMCTHHDDNSQHNLPCLHCQPHSYIRMVQHMIERCILLRMTRDECVKALDHHASILPVVTLTVWRGLQRENKEFFETYGHFISPRPLLSGHSYVRRSPRFAKRI